MKKMSLINFIIVVLFIIYIVCAWNSTKVFENTLLRISFILVGTLFITLLTLILFWISKIGVKYPKKEMIGEVRKIILLSFIPINGFLTLTQSASIFAQAKSGMVSKEEMKKKIKRLVIIFIILIVFEAIYFKNVQNGMIRIIQNKMV